MTLWYSARLVQPAKGAKRCQPNRNWVKRVLEVTRHQIKDGKDPFLAEVVQDFVDAGKWSFTIDASSVKA